MVLGADKKLIEQLSEEARDRMAVAISSFTAISNQLVHGNIRIKLLNSVLEKRDTFTELLKIGNGRLCFLGLKTSLTFPSFSEILFGRFFQLAIPHPGFKKIIIKLLERFHNFATQVLCSYERIS